MSILNIENGVSTIGNSGNTDVSLTGVDSNINSIKTLVDGQWKSWSKGAPDAFQGFNKLNKGNGYVVNSAAAATIEISDTLVDVNDINMPAGLNFVCFPFDTKNILDGLITRVEASSIKTIIGAWRSYSTGAPDAYQGFLSVSKDKGYVINVSNEYTSYLTAIRRDINNGARLGTKYMNTLTGESLGDMVVFEPDALYKTVDYTPVAYDSTAANLGLWISINGNVKYMEFKQELLGTLFSIKETALDIITYGTISEAMDASDDYGLISDTNVTFSEDYGDLTGGVLQTTTMYTGIFSQPAGNSEANPLIIDTIVNVEALELIYNVKTVNGGTDRKMLVNVGGYETIIEFAEEYLGEPFKIIKDDVVYDGVFTSSESTFVIL